MSPPGKTRPALARISRSPNDDELWCYSGTVRQATKSSTSSGSAKAKPLVLDDRLIVLGLVLVAAFAFWVTPQFAGSLPQDGADYAMPAINLLERGRLVVSAYGHDFPPNHPPGMPLLLLPAYMLFGDFPGNGIYVVLLCSLGTVALTYVIGMKLGGRPCGCAAALFLIANYSFWQFSRKIMSEVPSAFFGVSALALSLTIRDRKRPGLVCLAIGGILGFAIAVRSDNALLFVPAAVLLAWEGAWPERLRRVGLCLAGIVPFLVGLAVYDRVTFGSPWLTGLQYWGITRDAKEPRPLFSPGYVTKSGFMRLNQVTETIPGLVEGNGLFYSRSLLSEADDTRIFSHPVHWQLPGRQLYQLLSVLRSALGVMGLWACLIAWRTKPLRQRFVLWLGGISIVYVGFYCLHFYQDERYLLRLVPTFCLANGMGVAFLFARWPAKDVRATVAVLVLALIGTLASWNGQLGFPTGEQRSVYETLSGVSRHMDNNAVVVSNFQSLCVDAYVIRGTYRIAVPLGQGRGDWVYVGGGSTPTPLSPITAVDNPERLRELLRSGRPVYWLIDTPWTKQRVPELDSLARSFRLQTLAAATMPNGTQQPFFGRVYDLPQVH